MSNSSLFECKPLEFEGLKNEAGHCLIKIIYDKRDICNNLSSLFMQTAVLDKRTLISLLKANGQKLRSYGVANLSIFGSFTTGKPTADSDVDLLVDFDPNQKSYDNFMDLSFFLEDLFGRKVEVITPQSLSKYFGPHILKGAEHVAI